MQSAWAFWKQARDTLQIRCEYDGGSWGKPVRLSMVPEEESKFGVPFPWLSFCSTSSNLPSEQAECKLGFKLSILGESGAEDCPRMAGHGQLHRGRHLRWVPISLIRARGPDG